MPSSTGVLSLPSRRSHISVHEPVVSGLGDRLRHRGVRIELPPEKNCLSADTRPLRTQVASCAGKPRIVVWQAALNSRNRVQDTNNRDKGRNMDKGNQTPPFLAQVCHPDCMLVHAPSFQRLFGLRLRCSSASSLLWKWPSRARLRSDSCFPATCGITRLQVN
jgi:hypothetical protein